MKKYFDKVVEWDRTLAKKLQDKFNLTDYQMLVLSFNRYASPEKIAELESYSKQVKEESNPRPEEDMADWFKVEKPDESDEIEQEKTVHEKMYEIATAKYNPFSVGGSENIHDFDSQGGSEKIQEK